MNYRLSGHFTFEVGAAVASARSALGAIAEHLSSDGRFGSSGAPVEGRQEGLYFILTDEPKPAIAGFWLIFGSQYVETGPPGPPDRVPPYAKALFDAATEEVWWRNLRVSSSQNRRWSPVVVFEWLPAIAGRCALPPPGHPVVDAGGDEEEVDEDGWLEVANPWQVEAGGDMPAGAEVMPDPPESEELPTRVAQRPDLPSKRSLLLAIRGELVRTRTTHKGSFFTVLPQPGQAGGGAITMGDWLEQLAQAPVEQPELEGHALGAPVLLDDESCGFPASGWLTKDLLMWPEHPSNILPGDLSNRDIRAAWAVRTRAAVALTAASVLLNLGVSYGIERAAVPDPKVTEAPAEPAAQPALSVCSADHHKFVEEFRCQINDLASGNPSSKPTCGDRGSEDHRFPAREEDLRAGMCGLLDRQLDGPSGVGNLPGGAEDALYNYGHLAAAQACFNVLGHPSHRYAQDPDYSGRGRMLADPDRFLTDPDLGIRSLQDLVDDLEYSCATYRSKMEDRMEGAVFATHIGASLPSFEDEDSEPQRLRRQLADRALRDLSRDTKECFYEGMRTGPDAVSFERACGIPGGGIADAFEEMEIWQELKGKGQLQLPEGEEPSVTKAYVRARFPGGMDGDTTAKVWRCHLALDQAVPQDPAPILWDINLPQPSVYGVSGNRGVRSQLTLDAAMLSFEEGMEAGSCWEVVAELLNGYSPIFPLLGEPELGRWPPMEQQICGQVCAVRYRLKGGEIPEWLTQDTDVDLCVDLYEDVSKRKPRRGRWDPLVLPWNGVEDEWSEPDFADACAFNLIGQNYLGGEEEAFLVEDQPWMAWAGGPGEGDDDSGSVGQAVQAVNNMTTFGGSRSRRTCGHVATQCFTSLMLEVTGTEFLESYQWHDRWVSEVDKLARSRPNTRAERYGPWCDLVYPYLTAEGVVTEGNIDYTCRSGVDNARTNVSDAIKRIVSEQSSAGLR